MKRYSIIVRETSPGATDVELCQCDRNPEAIVEAVQQKRLMIAGARGARKVAVPKYARVYSRDNGVNK